MGAIRLIDGTSEGVSPGGIMQPLSVEEGHPVGHIRFPFVFRIPAGKYRRALLISQREGSCLRLRIFRHRTADNITLYDQLPIHIEPDMLGRQIYLHIGTRQIIHTISLIS